MARLNIATDRPEIGARAMIACGPSGSVKLLGNETAVTVCNSRTDWHCLPSPASQSSGTWLPMTSG